MLTAEVVIIGGGVVGASVAYHLAARGVRDVLVLDRAAAPGAGSTGRATGGFRAQFGTEVNVRLSLLAREKLLRFKEETGVDSGYLQSGYLFLAHDEGELDALRDAQDVQLGCGLYDAFMVGLTEIMRLNPALNAEGIVGGAYCPTDGFVRPLEIMRGYVEAAARAGARFEYGAALEGVKGGGVGRKVGTLLTTAGEVSAGAVVNAAGAWAAEVGRRLGAEIPVAPLRRQVAVTRPTELLHEEMPMTIFVGDGFHLRVRDGRVLLLWPDDPGAGDLSDGSVDEGWLATVVSKAHARVPCLREAEIDRAACWAGLYEMSPDRHALLGRAEGFDNLYLANGSSGHGVMHAPALGQLLAEIILDGSAHTLDVHKLRPSRFAEGEPNIGPELL